MLHVTALLPSRKTRNAPLAYISEALGDSNLKTTQNYFGRFEDEGLKVFHSGLMAGDGVLIWVILYVS